MNIKWRHLHQMLYDDGSWCNKTEGLSEEDLVGLCKEWYEEFEPHQEDVKSRNKWRIMIQETVGKLPLKRCVRGRYGVIYCSWCFGIIMSIPCWKWQPTLQDPSALGLAFCLVVQYVNGGEMYVPCPGCECPQRRLHVRNVGQRGFGWFADRRQRQRWRRRRRWWWRHCASLAVHYFMSRSADTPCCSSFHASYKLLHVYVPQAKDFF